MIDQKSKCRGIMESVSLISCSVLDHEGSCLWRIWPNWSTTAESFNWKVLRQYLVILNFEINILLLFKSYLWCHCDRWEKKLHQGWQSQRDHFTRHHSIWWPRSRSIWGCLLRHRSFFRRNLGGLILLSQKSHHYVLQYDTGRVWVCRKRPDRGHCQQSETSWMQKVYPW